MKISQCVLRNGAQSMVCWLESDKIEEGYSITLKDSQDASVWWEVASKGIPHEMHSIQSMEKRSDSWYAKDHRRPIPPH